MRRALRMQVSAALLCAAAVGLSTGCAGLFSGAGSVGADSADAIGRVRMLLHDRYRYGGLASYRRLVRGASLLEHVCDGGRGFMCNGGDPDAGFCGVDGFCHRPEGHFVDVVKRAAHQYPGSGFLTGQAVYALVKFARNVEAEQVADACRAAHWWCQALKGYVLDSDGRTREAEPYLRTAMEEAPDSIRCAWTDATWLVGKWDERNTSLTPPDARQAVRGWSCARKEAVSAVLWWLADPLYSVPGNERWADNVVRAMSARFAAEIRAASPPQPAPPGYDDYLWARRVRRGPWDSWEHLLTLRGYGIGTVVWTSAPKAAQHFVPDVALDDLTHPTWHLEAGIRDEGYTPDEGPWVALPVQLARFRRGDSLLVAGASALEGTPLVGAGVRSLRMELSQAPDSFAAGAAGDRTRRNTPVFLARVSSRRYVASVEVLTDKGIGWHREMLLPLPDTLPAVSDLLLYDPGDTSGQPTSVGEAEARMLGTTAVVKRGHGGRVGVFWETYGVPSGTMLHFDLSLERAGGGVVEDLKSLFGGGGQGGSGHLTWSEPGTAGTDVRGVSLDLAGIDAGAYTLVLRVSWVGHTAVESRRSLTLG